MRRLVYALAMMFLAWPAGLVARAEWLDPPASAGAADTLAGSGEPAAVMESGLDKERGAQLGRRDRGLPRGDRTLAQPRRVQPRGSGSARSISSC